MELKNISQNNIDILKKYEVYLYTVKQLSDNSVISYILDIYKYLEYIKKFIKISVPSICKKLKIDKSNLYTGKTTNLNIKKVRQEIESEIAKLYIKGDE